MAPVALTVEFLADGRCVIGPAGFSTAEARSATAVRPRDPSGSGFRCPIPYAALGTRAVDLRVSLPATLDRADAAFPRLDWHRETSGWVGTATLPSAPAFVSLHPSRAAAGGAAFGWNFYGFFVFAAAFIGLYFAWARWMRGREQARAHA